MLKRFAALGAAAAITVGGALLATPAQATVPQPQPVQNSVQRTVFLRAGEGCEFPVRISVRIHDLDVRRNGRITTFDADGVRGRVTNLRNGDTFRFSGDTERRVNRRTGIIRGEGDQLIRVDSRRFLNVGRNILPRRNQVNRLIFTEDPTRGLLLGNREASPCCLGSVCSAAATS